MDERDFSTYTDLFSHMANFMKRPNLIVHLDVSPKESQARINKRSREAECGIPLDYLERLHAGYEEFIGEISKQIPVIRVQWDQFHDVREMAAMIHSEWKSIGNVHVVDMLNRCTPTHPTAGVETEKDDVKGNVTE